MAGDVDPELGQDDTNQKKSEEVTAVAVVDTDGNDVNADGKDARLISLL